MTDANKTKSGQSSRQKTDTVGIWKWGAIALVIIGAAFIRGRLASMPLERDEGEYAYIAQQMLKGVPPYESAYSMKLPGIYAVYALFLAVFGQTITAIHLGLIIFNAATIFVVFWLTKRLFGGLSAVAAAAAYAVTSLAIPVLGLSANAEHFVILPALAGVFLIVTDTKRCSYAAVFIAGLLFGLAFIIKQHGIFFAVFAALYLLYREFRWLPVRWGKIVINQFVFAAGLVLPFALACFLLWRAGVFDRFWFWTFTYAQKYVSVIPLSLVPGIFWQQFFPLVKSAAPIWCLAVCGLISVFAGTSFRDKAFFTIGWLIFSFLAVCPGFYFREHYFIFILPAVAILAGAGFPVFCGWVAGPSSIPRRCLITALTGIIVIGYSIYDQRMYLFDGDADVVCRRIYQDNPFPESVEIAKYIKRNSSPDDTIAVLGSEPQIYFYSGRCAATRYIYMYPLVEKNDYAVKMQREMIDQIESNKPEFMVFVNVSTSWLKKTGSPEDIFKWANSYIYKFYNVVCVVDIPNSGQAVYRWDSQAANYKPKSPFWLAVFRRKP